MDNMVWIAPEIPVILTSGPQIHRWAFVYLHGQAEHEGNEDVAPDIFYANVSLEELGLDKPWPSNPYMPAVIPVEIAGKGLGIAVVTRSMNDVTISGRVALLSDSEGLAHVLRVKDWR